ncbi:MAG: ABC transporter ATP-binding protein [Phycisphaerales bacterium]|nr:ATP-binding cassette domain-containing protein [Planctomycetota bacterium]
MASPQSISSTSTAGSPPVVVCQNLTKVFKDFWLRANARAVDNLSFEIRPREVFGLLGPNGSGKSTTIKIILGLLRPTSGRVAVFGKPPSDVAIKKRIGYLPEESYLYQFLNARETLQYYAKLFQLDYRTREHRIDELIDMVGLSSAQFRPVRDYSKGMQRRIGIAQALINDPDFLILDEPTTGLDPVGTRQVKDLIIELGRRGKTILLSSHLLADVEDCVHRMVVLYGGQKREEGTCDSLLESQDRTTIEADSLDDATIAEIDEVIRRRTAGHKSILKVARPRQRLEEFFLQIVEKARASQVATSGALAGGPTASFLLGEGQQFAGDNLIDKLTAAVGPQAVTQVVAPAATLPSPQASGPDQNVIGSLLNSEPAKVAQSPSQGLPPSQGPAQGPIQGPARGGPAVSPARPSEAANIDADLISKLTGQQSEKRE